MTGLSPERDCSPKKINVYYVGPNYEHLLCWLFVLNWFPIIRVTVARGAETCVAAVAHICIYIYIYFFQSNSYEVKFFVESRLCKLCVVLWSRVCLAFFFMAFMPGVHVGRTRGRQDMNLQKPRSGVCLYSWKWYIYCCCNTGNLE